MDSLVGFWSKATWWVLIVIVIALVLVAIVFQRIRARKPPSVIRAPDPSWSGTDADNLDSSHIGGPIFPKPTDVETRSDAQRSAGNAKPTGAPK